MRLDPWRNFSVGDWRGEGLGSVACALSAKADPGRSAASAPVSSPRIFGGLASVIVKRFEAESPDSALHQARAELGASAVVLSSGPMPKDWWRFWQRRYQVLVAADPASRETPDPVESSVPSRPIHPDLPVPFLTPVPPPPAPPPPPPYRPAEAEPAAGLATVDPLRDEVVTLLKAMDQRLRTLTSGAERADKSLVERLEAAEVAPPVSQRLALAVAARRSSDPEQTLVDEVVKLLGAPAPASLRERVVITAVGPTGSGKTSLLARLAAHFALVREKRVLLVSADAFRMGASEQLKTFALILGVPLEVAGRPQDLEQVVSRSDHEVILVDTAGRSPYHNLHVAEVQAMVRAARTDELLVVLPASMRAAAMVHAGRRFGGAHEHVKLCFTKLDESEHPGAMVTAAAELGWPLGYFADGQRMPEDVGLGDPVRLGRWIVRGADPGS